MAPPKNDSFSCPWPQFERCSFKCSLSFSYVLLAAGHDPALQCARRQGPSHHRFGAASRRPAAALCSIRLFASPRFPAARSVTPFPGLRRRLRDLAPAAVISSEASLNLCTLIAVRTLPRRNRPKLVLREVGSPSIAQHHDPYAQNRIAYRILRRLYRYADRIVALTEGARRDLKRKFRGARRHDLRHAHQCGDPAGDRRSARAMGRRDRPRTTISSSASAGCRRRRISAR